MIDREMLYMLIGAGIALVSSIITLLIRYIVSLRVDIIKRRRDRTEKRAKDLRNSLLDGVRHRVVEEAIMMSLSREELDKFTRESVDPRPRGPVRRPYDNVNLIDSELRRRIIKRNREGKPTYLLRMEYERRLRQRGL